jgi:phenylpyruvate tautomerase PptA (4-oxalocrotonate tautomerase family)
MPLARISLLRGKSNEYLEQLSQGVHDALVETFEVPPTDRFQVIQQLERHELSFDRHYLGGPRSEGFVIVNISAGKPRSTATKRVFYAHLAATLNSRLQLDPEDLLIIISMSEVEDWSFGGGRMNPAAGGA